MKKFIALALTACMLFGLTACGEKQESGDAPKDTFTVGICQLVQHEALDAATKGFIDAVEKGLGDKVTIQNQNASGEITNCTTIINGFVSGGVDLIMANATPALLAAASATDTIPILGTSITHYGTALEIDNWTGTVGRNISGTSDLAPLDAQAKMIVDFAPEAKTVGVIFCSAEPNSVFQVEEITKFLAEFGVEVKEFSFTDTNDVASVTEAACRSVDAIYLPTDNTVASNTEAIANIIIPAGIPAFCGEKGLLSAGCLATISIDYYDIGFKTGEMAVEILRDGADITSMPVEFAPVFTPLYSEEAVSRLGLSPVEGYEPAK